MLPINLKSVSLQVFCSLMGVMAIAPEAWAFKKDLRSFQPEATIFQDFNGIRVFEEDVDYSFTVDFTLTGALAITASFEPADGEINQSRLSNIFAGQATFSYFQFHGDFHGLNFKPLISDELINDFIFSLPQIGNIVEGGDTSVELHLATNDFSLDLLPGKSPKPVPEPSSLLTLIMLGGLGSIFKRKS